MESIIVSIVTGVCSIIGVILASSASSSKLQKQLKRNLTHDEWSYYIGRNIPYETFTK
jgi:hypothetical protein